MIAGGWRAIRSGGLEASRHALHPGRLCRAQDRANREVKHVVEELVDDFLGGFPPVRRGQGDQRLTLVLAENCERQMRSVVFEGLGERCRRVDVVNEDALAHTGRARHSGSLLEGAMLPGSLERATS